MTDQVDYNVQLLNPHDLSNAYFCLSKDDPTHGFAFDATAFSGNTYPASGNNNVQLSNDASQDQLRLRLLVGSHLAHYIRAELEHQRNYTATVGVSTNKLLSKLVGNVKKPNGQTTLLPPYDGDNSNVVAFIDAHDIGKIPGIGFKLAQKLREFVLQRPAAISDGLIYGGSDEGVAAGNVRKHAAVSADSLEKMLGGPGAPHGIGKLIWGLLHGCDDSDVGQARDMPKQISIEESYIRLDTFEEVVGELKLLALSLMKRMHLDLLGESDEEAEQGSSLGAEIDPSSLFASDIIGASAPVRSLAPQPAKKRWIARPRTLRLSTRPRPPIDPATNTRPRTFARISRSSPLPNFVFSLSAPLETLAERLVNEALLPLFRRLHPEKSGWNLSLVNVAVTNMADSAGDAKTSSGRDISAMFKKQKEVLDQWRVTSDDPMIGVADGGHLPEAELSHSLATAASPSHSCSSEPSDAKSQHAAAAACRTGSEDLLVPGMSSQDSREADGVWIDEADGDVAMDETGAHSVCDMCGALMPAFAMAAHGRFHALEEQDLDGVSG